MAGRSWCAAPLLSAVLLLGGCGGEVGVALVGATAVSFATTDKFLTDHAVSLATGEDCSSLQLEQTGRYCRASGEMAAERAAAEERQLATTPEMYCYRTLGEITCYDKQDYQASLAQQVR